MIVEKFKCEKHGIPYTIKKTTDRNGEVYVCDQCDKERRGGK